MFIVPIQIQWLHLDPNRHVRHSAFFDFGAFGRIALLNSIGLNPEKMMELKIGPVLFREEAFFKREILFGDDLTCQVYLYKATKDYNRWGFRHDLVKSDGTLAATIFADGAWLDTSIRKLTQLPQHFIEQMESIAKSDDFEWIEKKS